MKTRLLLLFAFLSFQVSFAKSIVADPVAPSVQPLTYCDPNNDGFGEFDFTSATSFILAAQSGNASDYAVTYHGTALDADTGANPLPNTYNNITPWNQIVYYRITNLNTSAYATGQIALVDNPTPEATIPVDLSMCDLEGNGTEVFNLEVMTPQILGILNPATHSVAYYTSLANAEAGFGQIIATNSFVAGNGQTIYARVANNTTACYKVVSFQLHVEPLPNALLPGYPQYALCDATGQPGYETFDLTSKYNSIVMGQTGVDVTFYPSLADAQNDVGVITNPSGYINQTIYVQTLGIRLTNQATGCYTISTMDIKVEPLPQLTAPSGPYSLCDTDGDGIGSFDLEGIAVDLLQGAPYSLTFHETQADAESGSLNISGNYFNITPFQQTIYARAQDPGTFCYSITPIELKVNQAPQINYPPELSICDTDFDGIANFNLTLVIPVVLGALNPDNHAVTFHRTYEAANSGTQAIATPNNYTSTAGVGLTEGLVVRVEDTASHCYDIVPLYLTVNIPLPLSTPTPLSVCDSDANPNDQFTAFDLTVKDNEITQGIAGYTVTYYPSITNAQAGTNPISNPTAYTNNNAAVQTLGVRVTSPSGCFSPTTLDIRVLPIPLYVNNPPPLRNCDADGNGSALFDLTLNSGYISTGDPNLTLHYYHSLPDANANMNEIFNPTAFLSSGGSVWIRVENTRVDYQGNHCYVVVEQALVIGTLQPLVYASGGSICVDYVTDAVIRPLTLQTNVGNPSAYNFEWYQNGDFQTVIGTGPTYTVDTPSPNGGTRHYAVGITSVSGTGCNAATFPYAVSQSGPAAVTSEFPNGYTVTNLSGTQSINVLISGYGTYQYSLDNAMQQQSNVFENVSLGNHTVRVWDTEGNCTPLSINNIVIAESQVPAPTGMTSQTLAPGSTLANIVVNGTNVQWYAAATNKDGFSLLTTALPLNTLLVDGTTYYATQTVGGIQSTAYLPVTVHLSLGVDENEMLPIQYAPNPVKDKLTLQSTQVLKSILVYTMLGQKVMEQHYDNTTITVDLSGLASGSYILKAQGETGQKTVRIIKE